MSVDELLVEESSLEGETEEDDEEAVMSSLVLFVSSGGGRSLRSGNKLARSDPVRPPFSISDSSAVTALRWLWAYFAP